MAGKRDGTGSKSGGGSRRGGKGEGQQTSGAGASERYRGRQKAKGIPPGPKIDSLLAEAWLKQLAAEEKAAGFLIGARRMVFEIVGWDKTDRALVKAVDRRIATLLTRRRDDDDPAG